MDATKIPAKNRAIKTHPYFINLAPDDLIQTSFEGKLWDLTESNSRPLKNALFSPISVSDSNFNPRNTQCMPVVKIFACLDFEQNRKFFKGLAFMKFALLILRIV